jgi:hypothetical protein
MVLHRPVELAAPTGQTRRAVAGWDGGYWAVGFLSRGQDLNAKNHRARRFRKGKRAKMHQRAVWPVRRKIFPVGSMKRRRSTVRKAKNGPPTKWNVAE